MSVLDVVQWVVNVVLLAGVSVCFIRLKRPPKDDPRLSRGLQLLQSKISVLEDLSDRTEVQVTNITKLLEAKTGLIQTKIQEAELQIRKVEVSMAKSREVASIFQDKIPHDEIVERKNTLKYVQAARLANKGADVEEIVRRFAIPRAEAEFITKVNKEELMFDESQLPEWIEDVKSEEGDERVSDIEIVMDEENGTDEWQMNNVEVEGSLVIDKPLATRAQRSASAAADFSRAFVPPEEDYSSLKKIGDQFREACSDFNSDQQEREDREQELQKIKDSFDNKRSQFTDMASRVSEKMAHSVSELLSHSEEDTSGEVVPQPRREVADAKYSQPDVKAVEGEKVRYYPSNYVRNHLAHFDGKKEEIDKKEVLKVKFPSVDGVLG